MLSKKFIKEKNNILYKQKLIFYGESHNEMLAPRGVYMHQNILSVSDTGKNRVLIWNDFLFQPYQKCNIVLGQSSSQHAERNGGETVNASSLQYPSGIWTNGEKLIVADAWNHRVLIWHTMPTRHNQPANVVVGQMNFNSNQPNVGGIGKLPTAQTLYWPYGVCSNGKALWIADTGNRRVLYFNTIPEKNFAEADKVIGQENFSEREYNNENAIWPYSVKISSNDALAIVDTQYSRVLLWQNSHDSFRQRADIVLGQKNFSDNGQNQYRLKPSAHTLNWVYDCCFINEGMAVADSGNSRIILHEHLPDSHNRMADGLIGQPDFEMHGETSLSFKTTIEHEMYWPFAVNTFENYLLVADTGNHRILFYTKEQ